MQRRGHTSEACASGPGARRQAAEAELRDGSGQVGLGLALHQALLVGAGRDGDRQRACARAAESASSRAPLRPRGCAPASWGRPAAEQTRLPGGPRPGMAVQALPGKISPAEHARGPCLDAPALEVCSVVTLQEPPTSCTNTASVLSPHTTACRDARQPRSLRAEPPCKQPRPPPAAPQVKLPAQPNWSSQHSRTASGRWAAGARRGRRGGRACLHGGRRRLEELAALRRDDLGQVLHKVAEARARPGRLRARELRRGQQRDQRDLRARGGPGSARARRGRRDRGWAGIARPRLRSAAQARAPPPRSCPADPRCAVQGLQGGG
jgi:hypothetical protein